MIYRAELPSVVHVLDSNAMQRSLIAKALSTETIETKCHENWEDLKNHYSPDLPGCLVVEYRQFVEKHAPHLEISGSEHDFFWVEASLPIPFIFIAEQPTISEAVTAMRFGAIDFLEKPICNSTLCKAVRVGIQKCLRLRKQQDRHAGVKAREERLTKRERETMTLVLEGMSIKQIASSFGIGLQTAAKHRARLLTKMDVRSDAQLVQLMYSNNLTPI